MLPFGLKTESPQRQVKQEDKANRPLDALININHLFQALKQLELTTQDVLKIEKILKDRGLVDTIVKRGREINFQIIYHKYSQIKARIRNNSICSLIGRLGRQDGGYQPLFYLEKK